jgi:Na+-transporting methylmalonyl-CoA/oxaloacetate decarboxylase gamma subunit
MKVFLSPFEKREKQEEVQAEEQKETVAEVVEEAIENGEEQQVALANSMEGQAPKSKWEGALKVEDLILS